MHSLLVLQLDFKIAVLFFSNGVDSLYFIHFLFLIEIFLLHLFVFFIQFHQLRFKFIDHGLLRF